MRRTAILELILQTAKDLRKIYTSTSVTQVHFILAMVHLYYYGREDVKKNIELLESLELLKLDKKQLLSVYEKAIEYLKVARQIDYYEISAFDDVLEYVELDANVDNKNIICTQDVIKKILQHPHSATRNLMNAAVNSFDESIINEEFNKLFKDSNTTGDTPPMNATMPRTYRTNHRENPYEGYTLGNLMPPMMDIQDRLRGKVFGQDEAISTLVSGYFNSFIKSEYGSNKSKPRATFLFAGAPGVGKTYLAQEAAKALHLPFRRFDMSSFSDKEAPFAFAGTDKVYKNSHPGHVTDFVSRNPNCVLLFDEIEKAHINVIHLFLQILDAGRLKDNCTGKQVSFEKTVIIFTTNAGKSLYDELEPGSPMPNRKAVMNAISTEINPATGMNFFPEAICSRFAMGNVVLFNPLGAKELMNIANSRISEYSTDFADRFVMSINSDDNIAPLLLYAEGGRADARMLNGRTFNFISTEVYNWSRFAKENQAVDFEAVEEIELKVDIEQDGIREFFIPQKNAKVLLYSEREGVFEKILSAENFNFILTSDIKEAEKIVATEELNFAICDVVNKTKHTLNIEDISSDGRKLMDVLIKEKIPVLIYCNDESEMNNEERHAFLENGAAGLLEITPDVDVVEELNEINRNIHIEKKLFDLRRSHKMMTFDTKYEINSMDNGVITLRDLKIVPAVDVDDRKDLPPLEIPDVNFEDIIGAEDAKQELKSFISYLKDPRSYAKNNIPAPKGVILFGPPGTGKTMLAKALAHESKATFIALQGNDFLNSRVGEGAEKIKKIFSLARKYAPTIVFIDEIDIIAQDRMKSSIANDVVNALLNEMDGFRTNATRPVFVLAATNFDVTYGHDSKLDAALLRRFDRRIYVNLPNKNERLEFIAEKLKNSNQYLSSEMLENIAIRSMGMSLADIGSAVDFALRDMLRNGLDALNDGLLSEAFEVYCFGEKEVWSKDAIYRIAVHEAGHAIIEYLCGHRPTYITITSRTNVGGYVQTVNDGSPFKTKKQLLDTITCFLGGRAAELVFFGDEEGLSTGVSTDLKHATSVAVSMATLYGMSQGKSLLVYEENQLSREETVEYCNEVLEQQLEKAITLITQNKDKVERLVEELINKNSLIEKQINEILK